VRYHPWVSRSFATFVIQTLHPLPTGCPLPVNAQSGGGGPFGSAQGKHGAGAGMEAEIDPLAAQLWRVMKGELREIQGSLEELV